MQLNPIEGEWYWVTDGLLGSWPSKFINGSFRTTLGRPIVACTHITVVKRDGTEAP